MTTGIADWIIDNKNRGIFDDTGTKKNSLKLNKLRSQAVCDFLTSRHFFILHYGASSLDENKDGSERICNISVLQFPSDMRCEFSLRRAAAKLHVPKCDVAGKIDELERKFLGDFIAFVQENQGSTFVYYAYGEEFGMSSLLRRADRLNIVYDSQLKKTVNNAINLYDLVAPYFNNKPPRSSVEKTFRRNKILPPAFLDGRTEVDAYREARFDRICESTNVKTRMFLHVVMMIKSNMLISPHKNPIETTFDWIWQKMSALSGWAYDHPVRKALAVLVILGSATTTIILIVQKIFGWNLLDILKLAEFSGGN